MLMVAGKVAQHERAEVDEHWNHTVEHKLIPHPKLKHKGAFEAAYGMRSGALLVKCRAAVAGYALCRWGADCSQKYCLSETEFQLALANQHVLTSLDSSVLAPGRIEGVNNV